jgi:endoglucanase
VTRPRYLRRLTLAAGVAVVAGALGAAPLAAAPPPPVGRTLAPNTRFYVPPPAQGSAAQIRWLLRQGDVADAELIAAMEATPTAVWFTSGTPGQVRGQVRETMARAAAQESVPVLVAYDIPGRDCAQYSAGGALNLKSYEEWISAFAAGIGHEHQAVVILEPDSLGLLPSSCGGPKAGYPFDDADRYAEIQYAVSVLEKDPGVSVYLDGTHPAWLAVGDAATRLVTAGVQNAQGFFLNISNYQYATNSDYYGIWVSDCIALGGGSTSYNYSGNCPNQYWNGGPATSWSGTAMNPFGVWSEGNATLSLNTSGIDSRYASMLGSTTPTTQFVVDTSRDGQGPDSMQQYAASPYDQPSSVISALASGNWCNPPGSGLGLRPTANTAGVAAGLDSYQTVPPLLASYLWVKVPGQSDGQCDAAGGARAWDYSVYNPWGATAEQQANIDPLWSIETNSAFIDPAAGAWFSQQALQLAQDASPALTTSPLLPPAPRH